MGFMCGYEVDPEEARRTLALFCESPVAEIQSEKDARKLYLNDFKVPVALATLIGKHGADPQDVRASDGRLTKSVILRDGHGSRDRFMASATLYQLLDIQAEWSVKKTLGLRRQKTGLLLQPDTPAHDRVTVRGKELVLHHYSEENQNKFLNYHSGTTVTPVFGGERMTTPEYVHALRTREPEAARTFITTLQDLSKRTLEACGLLDGPRADALPEHQRGWEAACINFPVQERQRAS